MTKISTNDQKVDKKRFEANFEAIFGKKDPSGPGAFTQDLSGKMVPRGTAPRTANTSAMIRKPMEEFVSPIDQSVISSHSQLDAHNRRHGVTNSSDYSDGYIENRARARNAAGEKHLKETRRTDINDAIQRHT